MPVRFQSLTIFFIAGWNIGFFIVRVFGHFISQIAFQFTLHIRI